MNNYRVSVDLTITTTLRSDLNMVDVGGEVIGAIYAAMRSQGNFDIRVGKVSTDLLSRPPMYATPPSISPDITIKAVRPIADDDEFLEPEWGIYEDDGT